MRTVVLFHKKNSLLSDKPENTVDREDNEVMYEHHHIVVDKGQSLLRIDKFLVNRIESVSRNKIQNAITAGNVKVNEQIVKPNYKIKPEDVITVVFPYPAEFEVIPEDIPLNIVFEDDDLLIINKPAGFVVHPGYGNYTGTMVNALAYYLEETAGFDDNNIRHGLVHRIDKDTTGLLVVAKTELALNRLAKQFFDKTVERTYYALVWGNLKNDKGTITGNVGRSPRDRRVMTVFDDAEKGKHAVTHYRVLKRFQYTTLVACNLETGRTHQIRIHFKHIGHPLFGDKTYGGDQIVQQAPFPKFDQFVKNCFAILPRQALHAKTLGFTHPTTGKFVQFDSELPEDFRTVLDKWEKVSG
ncbi:MAG: RluA family pseudouridine synthase [Bacteroidales bacterium]|nr:RluA family pseudouridine synthase [Bacteroidales bacterium]